MSSAQRSKAQYAAKELAMALQLALPLVESIRRDDPMRQAWLRSGLALPYERARQDPALAICLRCLAEAMRGKRIRRRRRPAIIRA